MVNLLHQFSIQTIMMFIVLLALAIKGCISFFDWVADRTRKAVHKSEIPDQLQKRLEKNTMELEELKQSINTLTKLTEMLIQSDKDAIKSFITKQHHFYVYNQGWIDDYNLQCIESRYGHYKEEGGNTFIDGLMGEIRELPKKEPNIKNKTQDSENT